MTPTKPNPDQNHQASTSSPLTFFTGPSTLSSSLSLFFPFSSLPSLFSPSLSLFLLLLPILSLDLDLSLDRDRSRYPFRWKSSRLDFQLLPSRPPRLFLKPLSLERDRDLSRSRRCLLSRSSRWSRPRPRPPRPPRGLLLLVRWYCLWDVS
jgi:hypothetical protein